MRHRTTSVFLRVTQVSHLRLNQDVLHPETEPGLRCSLALSLKREGSHKSLHSLEESGFWSFWLHQAQLQKL